jgi:predicted dehydrogenase
MSTVATCRRMIRKAALAGVSVWTACRNAWAQNGSPNEKLDVALIGIGGRGEINLKGVAGENIVALCDVDDERAGRTYRRFRKAKKYYDFRRMLDEMGDQIDAVVVSTPDHTHSVAAGMAIQMGKHCFCEKPLARSVGECRTLTELAAKHEVITQLGVHRHALRSMRQTVEVVRSGVIGQVREVHAWTEGAAGMPSVPTDTPPVPAHLKWDLWLGPAPDRPYHPAYVPHAWRLWWDFGTGEIGNWGCHVLDIPFWALELGQPAVIEAEGPPSHPQTTPTSMRVRYEFPADNGRPPLMMSLVHGSQPAEVSALQDAPTWKRGVVFIGDKGTLVADFARHRLLAGADPAAAGTVEHSIPDSIGHWQEWIVGCKESTQPSCHWGYGGPLTETVLLGNAAYRVGQKLEWDAVNGRVTNCPEVEPYVNPAFRAGWSL